MKTWLLALLLLAIAGCANFNSIFRKTETESGKAETILIDAKQRPITVNRVTTPNQPITCLARSADALSQAAASGNLKIDQASSAGGEAGFAFAEQVSSIAFRTQVTEAQQEFLYYLCQFQANGVLKPGEVADNLRHFQNTMLAMVAIDDLAGAARPKPAVTTPTPGGDTTPPTTPDPSDPKVQAVKAAQSGVDSGKAGVKAAGPPVDSTAKSVAAVTDPKDLDSTTKALGSALTTYDKKQKTYASALAQLNTSVKALKGTSAKVPADVTSATTAAATALKDVKTDYTKVTDAIATLQKVTDATKLKDPQDALTQELATYKTAVTTYETQEDALGTALTAWNVAADDSSKPKPPAKDPSADSGGPEISATVANDVAIIVQTIVWQSFVTEQCQKALFDNYTTTAEVMQLFCLQHLLKADEVREKQLLGTLAVPSSGKPTPPPPNLAPTAGAQPLLTQQSLQQLLMQSMQEAAAAAAAQQK